jgi:hypothetical protein
MQSQTITVSDTLKSANTQTIQNKYPSNLREYLEIGYFLSAPLLLIAACIGLLQLKLTKDNARISAKREAYRLAAEQVSIFCNHIIPLQNKLDEKVQNENIIFLKASKVEIEGSSVKIKYSHASIMKFLDQDNEKIIDEFLDCFNSMEGFAIYFTNQIAYENAAFSSIGDSYCGSVKSYLPMLVLLNEGKYFNNVLQLFFLWNKRLEKENLLQERTQLEQKINRIDGKFIDPLGV